MAPWKHRPRRARAGTIAKWALSLAVLCRLQLLSSTIPNAVEMGLFYVLLLSAFTSVIAAACRFALPEVYEEDDNTTPRSFRLLLVCLPIVWLLLLSMAGIA